MPTSPRETVLCRYHYDPLDRSIEWTPDEQAGIQRFYCKTRLATEIQGATKRNVFQHDDQLLAQLRHEDLTVDTLLLATDQQRSILNALDANQPHPFAYTPYGHRSPGNGLSSLLGFNGERPDPVTGHYHLGNGYRQFNPMLMRFNSPDSLSPFGEGGVNAYAYCQGNPVNQDDPTGHRVRRVALLGGASGGLIMIGVGVLAWAIESDNGPLMALGAIPIVVGGALGFGAYKIAKRGLRTSRNPQIHAPGAQIQGRGTRFLNPNLDNGIGFSTQRSLNSRFNEFEFELAVREFEQFQTRRAFSFSESVQSSRPTTPPPSRSMSPSQSGSESSLSAYQSGSESPPPSYYEAIDEATRIRRQSH
ncbi:RHS repeat-associated core domain-containing protein [Pseudomonas sp. WJP1]|uniref:RHS repeat-associated core domain-containing protein n=1 Tax=Pseudomonas sp. WJP1 TaxID=2986947 RepID=UPI00234A284F|nr:RHS repeat-associated core domain-containing protein [Pseudomonas sp. WJP1]WCM49321.1 RHS repeat-associated core domain-containing protein [Pseudomonas sp. WJP1]